MQTEREEIVEMLRQSMQRDLWRAVRLMPIEEDLKKLAALGVTFEIQLVRLEVPVKLEAEPDAELDSPSPFELTLDDSEDNPKMTYTQTCQALAKVLPSFGRRKFTAAEAAELLKRRDFLGFDGTHVSLVLSTNKVPGMKFAKTQVKRGNRKINVYRKTR